jgi:hypothetical protein
MWQVRSWIPWTLVVVLTALAVTSAVAGARADRDVVMHRDLIRPFSAPAGTLKTGAPPQAGYRGIEDFCAKAPLTGTIRYDGEKRGLSGVLRVRVGGLPRNSYVFVNWSNNYVRAPVIASFKTDSKGAAVQSSVNVVRLAEVKGVEIVLSAATVPNPPLGRLEPCSPR